MVQHCLSERKEERVLGAQRNAHLAPHGNVLLRIVLVCSIDERIPTERITSIHRSPDTVGEGIAQMSFETRERLLPEYFPTVVLSVKKYALA